MLVHGNIASLREGCLLLYPTIFELKDDFMQESGTFEVRTKNNRSLHDKTRHKIRIRLFAICANC